MVSPVPAGTASEGASISGERVKERVWMILLEELGFLRDCLGRCRLLFITIITFFFYLGNLTVPCMG